VHLLTALVCAFVLTAGVARADTADELAHKHFESGAAYLEQADYESALREFNKAYELSKRAEILLNVATVNERMSKLKDAVTALEQYLAVAPQGEHAETVEIRIENLKKRIAAEPAPSPAPTAAAPAPAPPPPTPAPTPPP
jgi:tetratricopeptide (TPR) repeat protein